MTRDWHKRWADEVAESLTVQPSMFTNDVFIMNSLVKCGVDDSTSFSLLWGDKMASFRDFPLELKEIVADSILEEKKKEESFDSQEKRIHSIIIELLQVLYKKQVTDTIKVALEKVKFYK